MYRVLTYLFIMATIVAVIGYLFYFRADSELVDDSKKFDSSSKVSKKIDQEIFDTNSVAESKNDKYVFIDSSVKYEPDSYYIVVTGVDSRLGSSFKHADANHILAINFKNKKFTIYSVPRDTPTDYPLNDTAFYKLTELRAKGRKTYINEIKRITRISRIDNYVEFGFSQAKGMLEWLGYKDAASTLQILRSRKTIANDDFQRHYNQANFMKQMLIKHFDKVNGILGSAIIGGIVSLVDTDLSYSKASELATQLEDSGFPDNYTFDLRVVTSPYRKFQEVDFHDNAKIIELKSKIERYNAKHLNDSLLNKSLEAHVEMKLKNALFSAASDSALRPTQVINKLRVYFDQRAWLQLTNIDKRTFFRENISLMLINAYYKKGNSTEAKNVEEILKNEEQFLQRIERKRAYLDSLNQNLNTESY